MGVQVLSYPPKGESYSMDIKFIISDNDTEVYLFTSSRNRILFQCDKTDSPIYISKDFYFLNDGSIWFKDDESGVIPLHIPNQYLRTQISIKNPLEKIEIKEPYVYSSEEVYQMIDSLDSEIILEGWYSGLKILWSGEQM